MPTELPSDPKAFQVKRTGLTVCPDPARVLVRPFYPSAGERAANICARVLSLSEEQVRAVLEEVQTEFGGRHPKTHSFLKRRFEQLIIPYAMSDYATTFASVSLDQLLAALV